MTYFTAYSFKDGLLGGTIKSYLAAVRHAQISQGLGDPRMGNMLKGIKRSTRCPTRRQLPITPDILLKLRQVWQSSPDTYDTSMLWAATCMCFFGFLRVGEVVAPNMTALPTCVWVMSG